jgi:hypothetical protein
MSAARRPSLILLSALPAGQQDDGELMGANRPTMISSLPGVLSAPIFRGVSSL